MAQTYRLGSIVTSGEAPGMQYPRHIVDTETGESIGFIDEAIGFPVEIYEAEIQEYINRGDAYFTDGMTYNVGL